MTCPQCRSTGIIVPSTTTFADGGCHVEYHTDRATTCSLCDGTGEQVRTYAFPNGSAYMDWLDRNCDRCAKRFVDQRVPVCDLEVALKAASMAEGLINEAAGVCEVYGLDNQTVAQTADPNPIRTRARPGVHGDAFNGSARGHHRKDPLASSSRSVSHPDRRKEKA